MANLWSNNTPALFWRCQPDIDAGQWGAAAKEAYPLLGLSREWDGLDALLHWTLGEGQFGQDHWELSRARRVYYQLKPWLPRAFTRLLRQMHSRSAQVTSLLHWPVEERYAQFQWELMRQLLIRQGWQSVNFLHFWPQGKQFAFVLTHDIETARGQAYVRAVADLEEELGFRSSFNFVAALYKIDWELVAELRRRGFEIGVHGLYHDGKLFNSRKVFEARATRINQALKAFEAVGFRAPLTMRHPEWMQILDVEYDLSFFDTDPHEPIPGGTMTLWPFMLGHFVELPYTLVQDYTLIRVLGQSTPQIWLDKVDFIQSYSGMALLNTHPDYLLDETTRRVYTDFLRGMHSRDQYWHALPKEVARWWKKRQGVPRDGDAVDDASDLPVLGQITLTDDRIELR